METLFKYTREIISIIIIVSTILYIFLCTFIPVKSADSQGLIAMIGFAGGVIWFWLGNMAKNKELPSKE